MSDCITGGKRKTLRTGKLPPHVPHLGLIEGEGLGGYSILHCLR